MLNFSHTIRIILVKPSHPGNIGSVARAMKTMGLNELYLVSPKLFPHPEATALATHAEDILQQAHVVNEIVSALQDIQVVYATSANNRELELPVKTARMAAQEIINNTILTKTAIVFGPENYGLSNDDLRHAHHLIQIPTSPEYHSLNLAAAVQIVAYELFSAATATDIQPQFTSQQVSADQLEYFYQQFEKTCIDLQFMDPQQPRQLMTKCRQLFNRSKMDDAEYNILLGFLRAISARH